MRVAAVGGQTIYTNVVFGTFDAQGLHLGNQRHLGRPVAGLAEVAVQA